MKIKGSEYPEDLVEVTFNPNDTVTVRLGINYEGKRRREYHSVDIAMKDWVRLVVKSKVINEEAPRK